MPLNVKLVVVGGEVKTTEINLKLPSTVGRGRGTAVVLPHPLVSRNHCELYESDGKLMVRDLGSLNGTFVNNERITESAIEPGELLTIGTVTFRAVYGAEGTDDDEARTLSIPKTSDKTVKVNKVATVPAKPKPKQPAESDDEVLDVDFGKPLFGGEDEDDSSPDGPGRVTERLNVTEADDKSKTPGKGNKAVRKPPVMPPAADSDEGEGKLSSSSDDGLDDFLKDLKK